MRRLSLLAGLLALVSADAPAHEGPPYPIVVDRPTRYGRLSVWGDPDVGTGTFWIDLEPSGGAPLPDARVSVAVRPADGRLPEREYSARSTRAVPEDHRFQCEVEFDALGAWSLRIDLAGSQGVEAVEERIEVTLPGQGPVLDLMLYSFPFLVVGVLFILTMVRGRKKERR